MIFLLVKPADVPQYPHIFGYAELSPDRRSKAWLVAESSHIDAVPYDLAALCLAAG
jgi:hypothetical protein